MSRAKSRHRLGGLLTERGRDVLRHRNFTRSIFGGLLATLLLMFLRIPSSDPGITVKDLVGPLLSLTGFAFAVATTAVAVVLALPLNRATALMVVNSRELKNLQVVETSDERIVLNDDLDKGTLDRVNIHAKRRSSYLDLVFVFAWTAVISVGTSVVALAWLVAFGNEFLLSSDLLLCDMLTGIVFACVLYTASQMVASILAAYHVAEIVSAAYRTRIVEDTLKIRRSR